MLRAEAAARERRHSCRVVGDHRDPRQLAEVEQPPELRWLQLGGDEQIGNTAFDEHLSLAQLGRADTDCAVRELARCNPGALVRLAVGPEPDPSGRAVTRQPPKVSLESI